MLLGWGYVNYVPKPETSKAFKLWWSCYRSFEDGQWTDAGKEILLCESLAQKLWGSY